MRTRQSWFDTLFDDPVDGLAVSSVVSSGRDPALRMVDGFVRGIAVVGRCAATPTLLAFKVAARGQPIRVRVWVRFDWTAVKWWSERVVGGSVAGGRRARLLLVRSQGRLRHAFVLSRQRHGTTEKVARACITFDLAADEVPDDGLVIVELLDPTDVALPAPVAAGLVRQPTVGLQVDHVEIATPDEGPAPGTAVGWGACPHLGVATWGDLLLDDTGRNRAGVIVINPDRVPGLVAGTRATVSLTVRRPPRPGLRSLPKRALRRIRREVGRRLPDKVRAVLRPLVRRRPAQPAPPPAPATAPSPARALVLRLPPTPASAVPTLPAPTTAPPSPPSAVSASALSASGVSLVSGRPLTVEVRPGPEETIDLVVADELDGPALLCVELVRAKRRHGYGFQVVRVAASPAPVAVGH